MDSIQEARSIIDEILLRQEFQPRQNNNLDFLKKIIEFISDIISDVLDFINELLKKFFGWINISPGGNINPGVLSAGITVLRVILLLSFIALVIFIYVKLIKNKGWNKKLKAVTEEEIEEFIKNEDLPYSLAEKYKSEGNYRQSLRYLYISLLIKLNKREIIQIYKSKTNRQYLREVKKSCPKISGDFGKFTDAFAHHWYGFREIESGQLEGWFSKYHDMLERGVKSDEEK